MKKLPTNMSEDIFSLFKSQSSSLDALSDILGIPKIIFFRNSDLYPEQIEKGDLSFFDLENTRFHGFDFSKVSLSGANVRNAAYINCTGFEHPSYAASVNKYTDPRTPYHSEVDYHLDVLRTYLIEYDPLKAVAWPRHEADNTRDQDMLERVYASIQPDNPNEVLIAAQSLSNSPDNYLRDLGLAGLQQIEILDETFAYSGGPLTQIIRRKITRKNWGKLVSRNPSNLYLDFKILINMYDSYTWSHPYTPETNSLQALESMMELARNSYSKVMVAKCLLLKIITEWSRNRIAIFNGEGFDFIHSLDEREIQALERWAVSFCLTSRCCSRLIPRIVFTRFFSVIESKLELTSYSGIMRSARSAVKEITR